MKKGTVLTKARYLRNDQTETEKILWEELRKEKLGIKFRRQHVIENFILDFYAPKIKLAIELDGSQHTENKEYDESRTNYLKSKNIRLIRFWNWEIEKNLGEVITKIKTEITSLNPLFPL